MDEIKHFRERLAECQKAAIQIRQGEQIGGTDGKNGLVKAIKKKWPGTVVIKSFIPFEHVSNIRIYSVDLMGTIKASPPDIFTTAEVLKFANEYGTTTEYKGFEQEHFNVIKQHINLQTKERERFSGGCK